MNENLGVRGGLATDVGRRRQINEDWCGRFEPIDPALRDQLGSLWVVADGVGAYGTGEEASKAAGEALLAAFERSSESDLTTRLWQSVLAGNDAVWQRRRNYVQQGRPRPVMTTLLAVLIQGRRALIAHVGDCRAYLSERGQLSQLTTDHTWVAEQAARGLLRPDEVRNHPRGHVITRSLGQTDAVDVDLVEQLLEPGDRLVICSDGLTRHLDEGEIQRLIERQAPELAVQAMIELANQRGGEDNITVGVIAVDGVPDLRLGSDTVQEIPPDAAPPIPGPPEKFASTGFEQTSEGVVTPIRAEADLSNIPARQLPADQPGGPVAATYSPAPPSVERSASRSGELAPSHFDVVLRVARDLQSGLDFGETLESVMDNVVVVTGGERGFIMLWDAASSALVYSTGRNLVHQGPEAPALSRHIVDQVFEQREPLRIGDALADSRFNQFESVIIRGLRSVLCAPLLVKDRCLGVVYVESRLGAEVFSDADLDLLCAFASQAAIALENARLNQELKLHVEQVAALRANQENVLRSINSAIISLDEAGGILTANRVAEEIIGVSASLARGRRLAELLPASLHRSLDALLQTNSSEQDGPEQIELEVRLPHRGRAVLNVRALPLTNGEGTRVGSVLVVDDVTQERVLAEARLHEATEKERIKHVFGRYLAPAVVEQLMVDPSSVPLGGTRREITVLFADIRGFTGISERNPPEEVVNILNSYLACATEIILKHGGTLDKFLGDGVMAFFNAPLPLEGHVLAAVRAATEMQARLRELTGPGGARIAFGAGVNTGEAIVGNIGTAELMNYTVIGDVVNVAARLQGEARPGEVLLSAGAYQEIAEKVEVEELGSVHVKGRAQPVSIFKVIRLFD